MTDPQYPSELSGQSQSHPYYNSHFEEQAAHYDSQEYERNQGGPVVQHALEDCSGFVDLDAVDNSLDTSLDYEQNQGGSVVQHVSKENPEAVVQNAADNRRVTCKICQKSLLRTSLR
jgi:hypothetical protein